MKRIGIVVDNYKLPKFKEGLKELDLFSSDKPFTKGTTTIFVMCYEERIEDIAKMCKKLEIDFRRSN